MDFQNIPVSYQPAYTWLWNDTATKEEVKRQIDEMYDGGIRAFYILGEPEEFRPERRRTFLKPEYLSDEYIELVYFAYEYAKEKGMYTWLYNEGGFPSGMVCGKIRELHPELAIREIKKVKTTLPAGKAYVPCERLIAAFADKRRINGGDTFDEEVEVMQYVDADGDVNNPSQHKPLRSDIANPATTECFLELTHEKLYKRFGDVMGRNVKYMFDDEASMGSWSDGFDRIFYEKYGYDIADYMPYIAGTEPENLEQCRAKSDYLMLCGELVKNNYFGLMRRWLNAHGMCSVGHLDHDNMKDFPVCCRYGNVMSILREYDVPGIDVIWDQITYPDKDGNCCFDGVEFFPRFVSSAARQNGHSKCLSESFAVNGAHVVPEEMRFSVNFQAVQGISLFNFMVISFNRRDARSLQYRPNFIAENPGMDCLGEIDDYTARLSYILQNSKACVKTAIYYPQRTVCGGGKIGKTAADAFTELGNSLMKKGVVFDIVDEDFVLNAEVTGGCLVGEHVTYENVFSVGGELEKPEIAEKLSRCKSEIIPCVKREKESTLSRKLTFDNGDEAYFVCNTANETVDENITIYSDKTPYILNLADGKMYACNHVKENGEIHIATKLLRGEGVMIYLSDKALMTEKVAETELVAEVSDFKAHISRKYEIHPTEGVKNTYCESGENLPLGAWDEDFSGEVTYIATLPQIGNGEFLLDLGEVRYYAKIYVNGKNVAAATMPPYRVRVAAQSGDELKIVVANTPANVTRKAEFFEVQDPRDVGPYHAKMKVAEQRAQAGGLMNPIKIYKIIKQ